MTAGKDAMVNRRHDLLSGLQAVVGLTESLREGIYGAVGAEQAKALEELERQARLLEVGIRAAIPATPVGVSVSVVPADRPVPIILSGDAAEPSSLDESSDATSGMILIVDDDPTSRRVIRDVLRPLGMTMLFAQDGMQAVSMAEEWLPNLILLDLLMPGMSGFQVIERLRAHPVLASTPIIVLSALDDRASRLRGLRTGADDFLIKPFDREELRARVTTICRLDGARRQSARALPLEQVATRTPDAAVVVDESAQIIYANEAWHALVGTPHSNDCPAPKAPASPTALVTWFADGEGHAIQELLTAAPPLSPVADRLDTVLDVGDGIPVELTIVRASPVAPLPAMIIIRDRREQLRLRAAVEDGGEFETLGRVAAEIGHDVSALLAVVQQQPSLSAPARAALDRAQALVATMSRTGRRSRGQRAIVDAGTYLRDQATELANLLPAGITLAVESASDLPAIAIDPQQFSRVLLNLVFNARNALHGVGRIALTAEREANGVSLSVSDDGPGLAPSALSAINAATRDGRSPSRGLGLGIVRRIVEGHGGHLRADSSAGTGARFTAWLPAA